VLVYQQPLPFRTNNGVPEKPNVILILAEGVSSRLLNPYSNKHPNLTPALLEFSKQSMVVDSYYNHTAATYRGIRGQLCSYFPIHGGVNGWQKKDGAPDVGPVRCLGHIFQEMDYDTEFIYAARTHDGRLYDQSFQLGFDRSLAESDLLKLYLKGEKGMGYINISDLQFFRALTKRLQERPRKSDSKSFFWTLYSEGTHAGFEMA
jgi:lipoteichoic acid synthase